MFGLPGHIELLIVGFVILLLFGHRFPQVLGSLGQGLRVFGQSLHGDDPAPDVENKEAAT